MVIHTSGRRIPAREDFLAEQSASTAGKYMRYIMECLEQGFYEKDEALSKLDEIAKWLEETPFRRLMKMNVNGDVDDDDDEVEY